MGRAQRLFSKRRRSSPCKQESQITTAFGERDHELAFLGRDDEVFDSFDCARILFACAALIHPAASNRNHHDAGRRGIDGDAAHVLTYRVAQNDFLLVLQHLRTEAANGARRHFKNPRASLVVSQLDMHWAVSQVQCVYGPLRSGQKLLLYFGGLARRGCVDGLLEKRTVERIWLIEDRQHAQAAVGYDAFEREFAAFDKALDLDEMILLLFQTVISRIESSLRMRSKAAANSASSLARMTPRLPDRASGLSTHG